MFALLCIQGGKVQYWKNEAINLIAVGQEPFKDFRDFIMQMEAVVGILICWQFVKEVISSREVG